MPVEILDQPPYDDDSGDDGFNPDDLDDPDAPDDDDDSIYDWD